jgi:O-antigen/teichoic acid export membrane protein
VQGALLLVRPFMTFQVAAIAATIGEVTRSLHARDELRRHVVRASTFTTIIAVGNTAVLLALPDSLGRAVLGDSWSAAQPLLLPTGLQIVCLGLMTGVRSGILGMRAIRKAMILDVVATAIVLVACVSGAVIDGARGAVWAVAIGQAVMTVAWWMTFLAHSRDADPAAAGDPPPPPSTQMASVTVPSSPPA